MKRSQRHHLKDNEIVQFVENARDAIQSRRKQTVGIAITVAIAGGVALAYFGWQARVQGQAHWMLADALVVYDAPVGPPPSPDSPPQPGPRFISDKERYEAAIIKLKALGDAYPSTDAGLFARYLEGTSLMAVDKPADAAKAFQQVMDRKPNSFYGQMSRYGIAEAQARSGQYDQAIATYKDLAQQKEGPMPVDALLMQLGRVYLDAGKRPEAQQTFNRIVEEFPQSPFSADARRELDNLKKG